MDPALLSDRPALFYDRDLFLFPAPFQVSQNKICDQSWYTRRRE